MTRVFVHWCVYASFKPNNHSMGECDDAFITAGKTPLVKIGTNYANET